MSQIKLKHSGGNGVIIAAPSSNPAADRTITLPSDADGTIARTIDVAFKSYAIIADRKSQNINGGGITAGAYRTRDLNTKIADADNIVSISSNQFTLQAGTYKVVAHVPVARAQDRGAIRLYNVTDSSVTETGESLFQPLNVNISYRIYSRFTISAAKVYEIQMQVSGTYTTYGGGVSGNYGTETYTVVEIFKEV